MGSHNRRGKKSGPWDCVRRWSAPLPCRAVCWAMAECLTAAELHRRMETGPGAFGWSPATHGTMLAARQPPLPLIRLTLWLEHQEKLRHSTAKAPQEESNGQAILGWWVLHKMSETKEVWFSNLMTVPDLMYAEITKKMPWPPLVKVAVIVRNLVWMPSVRPIASTAPPPPPPHESLISGNPELWNQTSLSSAISTAHQHLETTPTPTPKSKWPLDCLSSP